MIDFSASTDIDLKKYISHFPSGSDPILQALKGHLLVEELLREIVTLQMNFPSALKGDKGASFDCHQIICLAEAMTPHSDSEAWLWVSAKKLNSLRNALAHQLTPNGLGEKIADLIKYANKHNPQLSKQVKALKLPDGSEFEQVILAMCCCLSALKAVLEHVKKQSGAGA